MFERIVISALMTTVLTAGSAFAGQNTGGDKARRSVTSGLNPQPLPPVRHRYRRRRSHGYSPQWGGSRHSQRHRRQPNALTVKQK